MTRRLGLPSKGPYQVNNACVFSVRGLRCWAVLLSTVALMGGATATSSGLAASTAHAGRIAFSVQHGDNTAPWDIYVVRTDGRWILRKKTQRDETDPAWSPDGRHIAYFASWSGGGSGWIYTMNPDGTHRRRLARAVAGLEWSPNSRRIAYDKYEGSRSGNFSMYVMNADGSGKRLLTRNGSGPVWSPDGKQIAFTRGAAAYVMNARGGRARRVGSVGYEGGVDAWAPGRKIIFDRSSDSGFNVAPYVVSADGSGLRKLRMPGYDGSGNGGWSPDGQLIVYVAGSAGIRTLRPGDGSVLTVARGWGSDPTWGAGGRKIAFTGAFTSARRDGLWVVNRDGRRAHRIAAATGLDWYSQPTWAPR